MTDEATPEQQPADRETLAAIFASRVTLAKKFRDEAVAEAGVEWDRTQKWYASSSEKEGSFLWFCLEFDLDAGAVRRAIRERK